MQRLGDYIKEYSVRNKLDEDIPVYSVTNSNGFCCDYFGKEIASNNKKTYKIVPRNAFAYNPSRINVGSVDYQHYEDRVIVSPLYNVFMLDEKILPQYLYFYLKNPNTMKRIRTVASGSVRDNLKLSILCEFPIQVPSINRQQNIIEILEKTQRIIDEKSDELEKLNNLIKARFVEMFDSSKTYPIRPLSDIAEYWNGLTYKPTDVSDGGTIVLRSSNIQNMQLDLDDIVRVKCDISNKKIVKKNDILMCSRNGSAKLVGKVALIPNLPEQMSFGAFMMIIRSEYYQYLMTYFQLPEFRSQISTGTTTINQITRYMLDKIKLPVPDKASIDEFFTFVTQVDKSKFAVQKSLEKTQLLFDSLMQEYFG